MDVSIWTPPHLTPVLLALLNREFQPLQRQGLRLTCRRRSSGQIYCRVVESRLFGRQDRGRFRYAVAQAVADLIIQEWEYFVGRRLFSDTGWLDDRDWNLVRVHLNEDRSPLGGYRGKMVARLADYLEDNAMLNVTGFVSFRLPDYPDVVGKIVGRILDDALLEQENHEFIRILKQFAQRQERPLDKVHVVILSGNRFCIYDEQMYMVAKNMEEGALGAEDEMRQEDLLIAALVTLAPRRVTIHGECMSATYNTLSEVFPGALHYCKGCAYCPTSNQA